MNTWQDVCILAITTAGICWMIHCFTRKGKG